MQVAVGALQRLHTGHPQSFHQPVLRRAEAALDAALGLRRMGRHPGDPQLAQRPADRRRRHLALIAGQALEVARHRRRLQSTRLGGVKRCRPAVRLPVGPQQPQVLFRRVVAHQARPQLAAGVVDQVDPIQLLAPPAPPWPALVHRRDLRSSPSPQPCRQHPLPQCFPNPSAARASSPGTRSPAPSPIPGIPPVRLLPPSLSRSRSFRFDGRPRKPWITARSPRLASPPTNAVPGARSAPFRQPPAAA